MTTVKTDELIGASLDWAVAKCEGANNFFYDTVATYWVTLNGKERALAKGWAQSFVPSEDWSQGGPIIDLLQGFMIKQCLESKPELRYEAHIHNYEGDWIAFGPTLLIAAMRCYVKSVLGDSVEIPDCLGRGSL